MSKHVVCAIYKKTIIFYMDEEWLGMEC